MEQEPSRKTPASIWKPRYKVRPIGLLGAELGMNIVGVVLGTRLSDGGLDGTLEGFGVSMKTGAPVL